MNINDKGQWEINGGFNPDPIALNFGATAGPHAKTVRATYIVPEGKKAFMESINGLVGVVTAATVTILKQLTVVLTKSNGVTITLFAISHTGNTVGEQNNFSKIGTILLNAKDQITIETIDANVGGTATYVADVSLTEIDY